MTDSPTTFVGPMNMGASFNKTSWRLKGHVIGTEARVSLVNCCTIFFCGSVALRSYEAGIPHAQAFNNLGWARSGSLLGVTGYGPNSEISFIHHHSFIIHLY